MGRELTALVVALALLRRLRGPGSAPRASR